MQPRATDKQAKPHRRRRSNEYFWEKDRQESVRAADEAGECIAIMLQRLEVGDVEERALKADPSLYKHLIAYGMEVHLNIAWYLHKMKVENRKRFALLLFICVLAAFGICAIPLFWGRFGSESKNDWNLIFFQLTAFPAAGFGILRVLSTLTDTRCHLGFFWRARSDLSEILYLFEHKWQAQVSSARLPEFWADIDAGINAARQITREERQKFFDSLQSASDVLTSAERAVETVSGIFQNAPAAVRQARFAPALTREATVPREPPEVAPPKAND
jgi:hypothetical protein